MKAFTEIRNRLLRHQLILLGIILFLNLISKYYSALFSATIFPAMQKFRCSLLSLIKWSIGDVAYCIGFLYLLYSIILIFKQNNWQKRSRWFIATLQISKFILVLSILMYLCWSALYAQPKLSEKMQLSSSDSVSNEQLFSFDSSLIQRMNTIVGQIDFLPTERLYQIAEQQYHHAGISFSLKAKPSLFAKALPYLGIEGYFNPFSGEAQINPNLPHFMLPFIITHEMAHQTGIAAEDDANLMAYIQCVESNDINFQYAAYFNIWLYTQRKVFKIDSLKANELKATLNSSSLAHLEVLKQRNVQYHTFIDDWSSYLFDVFLKMGNQQDGIGSYRNVAYSALCWEQKQKRFPVNVP